ncbi:GNAT family N-acetyltransferase [Herbaspirillum sp. ST 5-3]|uniref:GNAT family N-acetyltransferase n=1 Tax=Oxalobacteraceae TaxID=75682 RepID=UPI0010A59F4E|nr:GNAT family N-acetyltransferase [Herbaspirillum sp. ST 5-3]
MRRLAEMRDLEAVFRIYMEETVVRFLGFDPMPIEPFRPIFRELVESSHFWVYEVDGEVAGFYKAARHPGRAAHVAYLGSLAVAPKFQGRGVAHNMVTEAIHELQKSGIKRIELIVESDNPRGISFYERHGFEIEGTLRKFYKRADEAEYVNDYIMSRVFD